MNTIRKRKEELQWFAVYTRPKAEQKVKEEKFSSNLSNSRGTNYFKIFRKLCCS